MHEVNIYYTNFMSSTKKHAIKRLYSVTPKKILRSFKCVRTKFTERISFENINIIAIMEREIQ